MVVLVVMALLWWVQGKTVERGCLVVWLESWDLTLLLNSWGC